MIMKTKITSVLILLATSAFAFAESAPQAPVPADAGKPVLREHGNRQGPQARRGFLLMHMLLALSNEQLDEFSTRVAEVQKMTTEQKAEALKALPKPEMRRPQGENGKPQARGPRNGQRGNPEGRKQAGKPQGPQANKGAPMMYMLLSADNERLQEIAKRVAEVQKMTTQQKAEALKAMPKPEMRRPQGENGKPQFRGQRNDQRGKPAPRELPPQGE